MLFRREERHLVEERFLDSPLYELLEGAFQLLMAEQSQVVLHPSELFYQSFLILDTLKCKPTELGVAYCHERLWGELLSYFRENFQPMAKVGIGNGASPTFAEEVSLAIGCIMQSVAELLVRVGGDSCHLSAANALKLQLQHHAPLTVGRLDKAFRSISRTVDEEALSGDITRYMASEEMYSEDINGWLDALELAPQGDRAATGGGKLQGGDESRSAEASHVRIAPKKKTSVLVVLNAMFKAGWLVAEDGTKLTNRDFALNSILRHAFGIDKDTAISQTINPSNNINAGEKNQLLLRRLLDEDEMERYIKELQRELPDANED